MRQGAWSIAWHPGERRWFTRTGALWERMSPERALASALRLLRAAFDDEASGRPDDDRFRAWRIKSESKRSLTAALDLACHGLTVEPRDWNAPHLFACADCVADLDEDVILTPRRSMFLTRASPFALARSTAPRRWLKFLDEITCGDRELADWLQRVAGYCTTAEVSEQVLAFFVGSGANGKSVFASILAHVLGEYATTAAEDLLSPEGRKKHPEALYRLVGRRLVIVHEINEDARWDEARVKQLAGGDAITARPLYGQSVTFAPTHKLLALTNHFPRMSADPAIWRRLRVVPFRLRLAEGQRDDHLERRLRDEAAGILAWVLDGVAMWRARGLAPTSAMVEVTSSARREADDLGRFLEEACTVDPSVRCTKAQLHAHHVAWAAEEGVDPWKQRAFGKAMAQRGFTEQRDATARWWSGVAPRPW